MHTFGREIWRGKLKKLDNLERYTLGHGIWQENWKSWKMRNIHLTTWKMTKSLKKVKNEKCTLKDLVYVEKTEKSQKMRNTPFRTWNMARKTEKGGIFRNVHCRNWNMARKTEKGGKFRNVHCRTWNMARKLKITENEKYTL